MAEREWLTSDEAANRLSISRTTFYRWLSASNADTLVINHQPTTIEYRQTGSRGQGRISIAAAEVDRLIELMRVVPRPSTPARRLPRSQQFYGINVPLGRPND